jgi:MFS family permease
MAEDGTSGTVAATAVRYGAITMVALCFANALQSGEVQGFSQATESIRHALHVSDFGLGALSFGTGVVGALGSPPIGLLCVRHRRTRVLAWMFAIWALLMLLLGLSRPIHGSFLGVHVAVSAFAVFVMVKLITSVTEATNGAALPLISDYWPLEQRAAKISIFNAGAGLGAFAGIVGAGVLVDHFGWQWAFYMWVPFGVLGAVMMWTRAEPERGAQDAAFGDELAALSPEAALLETRDEDLVEELVASQLDELVGSDAVVLPGVMDPADLTRWQVVRHIFRLRSWRLATFGIGVAQIMTTSLMFWGTPYFKRTFHLSGTQVAGLAPLVGSGAFAGLLGGGFLADRLLRRGVLRARVLVSAFGYIAAAISMMAAFTSTTLLVSAPLLALGTFFSALPTGPQYALMLDVTPSSLRSQASSVADVVMLVNALGYLIVGGLSTLFGDNLRLALLCTSPFFAAGGLLVLAAQRTYVADVAMVVAEARRARDR